MTTLTKLLKDTNGNVILPKTRSEQVYRPDNTSVEAALNTVSGEIANVKNDVTNITTSITQISGNGYYEVTHSKSGTVHTLSTLPNLSKIKILHATFKATGDYVTGDTFTINNKAYSCKLITQEDAPDNLFKVGSVVTIHVELNDSICFFNYGGGSSEGGSSNPPPSNTYQLSELITSTRDWSPPQDGWYRIFCVGKSGNGGNGGYGGSGTNKYETNGGPGGSGGGGGSGGVSIYEMYIKNVDVIPITIDASLSSFGEFVSSTSGSNGGPGGQGGNGRAGSSGNVGTPGAGGSAGIGSGGNIANLDGHKGGSGVGYTSAGIISSENGGNDGGLANDKSPTSPYYGGGGARYATHNAEFSKYVMTTQEMRNNGYCGYIADASGSFDSKNTKNQYYQCGSYFSYDISHLLLTGGGLGGGGGSGGAWESGSGSPGNVGKSGCPGCIIIEKSIK